MSLRLFYADTVVFFGYSRFLCLWHVVKRIIKNYGATRPDIGNHYPEKFDFQFNRYVWNFKRDERKKNICCKRIEMNLHFQTKTAAFCLKTAASILLCYLF
jgi:topology modulation protein